MVQDDAVFVRILTPAGNVETRALPAVTSEWLRGGAKFRGFSYRPKQPYFPGAYWSATMAAHVGHESRLELTALLLADFDPDVTFILSQPFQLSGVWEGTRRRHVPDYLVTYGDARVGVIDVKPSIRLSVPRVAAQFAWTRSICEAKGWEHSMHSEPDSVVLANVRFLAGYRREWQFDPGHVAMATSTLTGSMSFASAVRAIAAECDGVDYARAVILRLLWTRALVADLRQPLQSTSILHPAAHA